MRASLIVPVMCAVAAASAPRHALDAQAPARQIWDAWRDALERHVPGQLDEPARVASSWSRADLQTLFGPWSATDRAGQMRLLRRALVLHADAAMLNRTAEGYRLPPETDGQTLLEDGRAIGQMSATAHWTFARTLIERAPRIDERTGTARVFYRATAAMLQFWGENPELTLHLAAARTLLRDDPVLLLIEGTQWQTYAGPRAQRFFEARRREQALRRPQAPMAAVIGEYSRPVPRDAQPEALMPSAARARSEAERLFRRAIAIDPGAIEARIRLAHVLSDAGRLDDAAAAIAPAVVPPASTFLDFYAALLTGRIERARGRVPAARAAFERAAAIVPRASSPRIGLSELALTEGRTSDALRHLTERARSERIEDDDPWWWLERMHEPAASALVDAMRRELGR